jgi:molybdopterin synthase catalytic subunit
MTQINVEHKFLIKGPINVNMVSDLIVKHQTKHELGTHSLFLGQVRADEIILKEDTEKGSRVKSIVYSAYEEMAEKEIFNIKEDTIKKYSLNCLHIYHSIGEVKTGEISLLVMASSSHRENCFDSLRYVVNEIKNKVPIWKKEIFEDGSHRWIE